LFGVSFGYVEAAVVVYLRSLYEPLHLRFHPGHAEGELFPLITLDQLKSAGSLPMRWLAIELVREAATLLMLAAIAAAVARNFQRWLGAFNVAFGLWDIFYYFFLKLLLNWPDSWLTWDLLFLLPVPWAGPVLAPVLVAASMIAAGGVVLWRESIGQPLRPGWLAWTAIGAGAALLLLAFCGDYRNLLDGGLPASFSWMLFALGEGLGLTGFLHSLLLRRPRGQA
jgi:hypothetical protein